MDFNETTLTGFNDEMEKIGGIGSVLSKGFKNLGTVGKRSLGQHKNLITKLYQRGAKGGGGVMGGLKGLAKSPYGSMAAAAGTAGLAGYGGYRMLRGNKQQRY